MFIIQSFKHDGGIYDYVQFDLLGITQNIRHCARWDEFKNANNFLDNMKDNKNFRVIPYEGP